MADETRKTNVFISYSRDDLAFADQLDAALGVTGFGTTLDRHGISAGEDWKSRLGALIRDADTIVFVLSPSSARSDTCAWEVAEAVRLGKRILPVLCRSLEGANPPPQLAALNYIYFYDEPRFPRSGFGSGMVGLVSALNTDLDWLREHTRYLQRATEWDAGGRPANRLLSGADIELAKAWEARRPKGAPELTALQLDFIKASEAEALRRQSAEAQRLQEMADALSAKTAALAEREEAQKREVEAQKREAEQAKRVVRRTLAGLVAAIVLAIAVGWFALEARKSTVRAEGLATATHLQLLAMQARKADAEANSPEDIGLAGALALEGIALAHQGNRPVEAFALEVADNALGRLPLRVLSHGGPVSSLAALADGRLASGGDDVNGKIKLWPKAGAGEPVVLSHGDAVSSLAVLADGRLASGAADGKIKLWPKDGVGEPVVLSHGGPIRSLAVLADGRLASGGLDGTIKLWPKDGVGEPVVLSHGGRVLSLVVLADGRLASGGRDGKIKLFLVQEEKLVAALCLRAGR
ncbi:TIR domain-containing protein, partial [uncultured Rhodoblastus sp.]|uniref:toll/interleukin-1 receptor domain-containing protein n=1 Tax=uncultured Rhodoblastus sp. TaxID=543037 RepID=UPI0025F477D2